MAISKSHLSYSDRDSYLVLLSEGHQLPWSFFTVCEQSHICPLCSSRPAGDSVRHPESKQLLPCEASRETESRFTKASTHSHRGKIQATFHSHAHMFWFWHMKSIWHMLETLSKIGHYQPKSDLNIGCCKLYTLPQILKFVQILNLVLIKNPSGSREVHMTSIHWAEIKTKCLPCVIIYYYSIVIILNIEWCSEELLISIQIKPLQYSASKSKIFKCSLKYATFLVPCGIKSCACL